MVALAAWTDVPGAQLDPMGCVQDTVLSAQVTVDEFSYNAVSVRYVSSDYVMAVLRGTAGAGVYAASKLVAEQLVMMAGESVAFKGHRYREGELAEAIEKVAFSTETGKVASPILAGGVLYLVQITYQGEAEADLVPYEEAEAGIREQLFEVKIEEAREEWYQVARRQAHVEILLRAPE